jgi:hypothetical protein
MKISEHYNFGAMALLNLTVENIRDKVFQNLKIIYTGEGKKGKNYTQ